MKNIFILLVCSFLILIKQNSIAQVCDTSFIKKINTNPASANSNPKNFVKFNGKLYFSADNGYYGQELFCSDGTANGTVLVKDIFAGKDGSEPGNFLEFNGKLYFSAETENEGIELWVTDGTTNGTSLVLDINNGRASSYPRFLTVFNGKLFFVAQGTSNAALVYESDGTSGGTKFAFSYHPADSQFDLSQIKYLKAYNNKLIFAWNFNSPLQYAILSSDGTSNGLAYIKNNLIGNSSFIEYKGKLYFAGDDNNYGSELWVTDATDQGTQLVKDINIGNFPSDPHSFIVYKDKLFFAAHDNSGVDKLWMSDGTDSGTIMLDNPNNIITNPDFFAIAKNILYFKARDENIGDELYQCDGTVSGITLVKDIRSGTQNSDITDIEAFNGAVFMGANDGKPPYYGLELWSYGCFNSEIGITGNNMNISNGSSSFSESNNTDFGKLCTGGSKIYEYSINNTDTGKLLITVPVSITGVNASDYSIEKQPSGYIRFGESTTFKIKFSPKAAGIRQAIISLTNNDGNESPFTFAVLGMGKAHTSSTANANACKSYDWNGATYTQTGVYKKTIPNSVGCDSVMTLNLKILSTSSTKNASSCDSYTWNGKLFTKSGVYKDTIPNKAGCDSAMTLNLTIKKSTSSTTDKTSRNSYQWQGNTYTESGTYKDTVFNKAGCDSILTLNLTIRKSTNRTDTVTACDRYYWQGNTYTVSGQYIKKGMNRVGCDSIMTLVLIINKSNSSSFKTTVCNEYEWRGYTFTKSGIYKDTVPNSHQCDSILLLDLTIVKNDKTLSINGSTITSNEASSTYQWVDCNNNYKPIEFATKKSYNVKTSGSYAVILTKNSTCIDTSKCSFVGSAGVFNDKIDEISSIYPNPTNEHFTINLNRIYDFISIEIYNSIGQKINSEEYNNTDVINTVITGPNGLYFIAIINSLGERTITSIIKN